MGALRKITDDLDDLSVEEFVMKFQKMKKKIKKLKKEIKDLKEGNVV